MHFIVGYLSYALWPRYRQQPRGKSLHLQARPPRLLQSQPGAVRPGQGEHSSWMYGPRYESLGGLLFHLFLPASYCCCLLLVAADCCCWLLLTAAGCWFSCRAASALAKGSEQHLLSPETHVRTYIAACCYCCVCHVAMVRDIFICGLYYVIPHTWANA